MLKKIAFIQLIIAVAMAISAIIGYARGQAFNSKIESFSDTTKNTIGIVVLVIGIVFTIGAFLQFIIGIFHHSILSIIAGALVVLPIIGVFLPSTFWWAAYVPIAVIVVNLLVVFLGKK